MQPRFSTSSIESSCSLNICSLLTLTAGSGMNVNCYLAWDEVTREAALFDTGFDAAPIFDLLNREQLQLKHLFITHTHRRIGHERQLLPRLGRSYPRSSSV